MNLGKEKMPKKMKKETYSGSSLNKAIIACQEYIDASKKLEKSATDTALSILGIRRGK